MSCARMRGKSARAMAFAGALALAVALWVAPGQALAEGGAGVRNRGGGKHFCAR